MILLTKLTSIKSRKKINESPFTNGNNSISLGSDLRNRKSNERKEEESITLLPDS